MCGLARLWIFGSGDFTVLDGPNWFAMLSYSSRPLRRPEGNNQRFVRPSSWRTPRKFGLQHNRTKGVGNFESKIRESIQKRQLMMPNEYSAVTSNFKRVAQKDLGLWLCPHLCNPDVTLPIAMGINNGRRKPPPYQSSSWSSLISILPTSCFMLFNHRSGGMARSLTLIILL